MAGQQLNPQLVEQLTRLREASMSRPMRGGTKRAPYLWMTWQEGEPQWYMADFASYVEEGYQMNAVIHAAVSYKERAISSVPIRAYAGDPDSPERLPPTHPLTRLVMRPNPYQSWREFQQQRVAYLNLAGNSYTLLDRPSRSAPPTALYNLRPDRVRIVPGKDGGLTGYVYKRNDEDSWKKGAIPILVQDMMHKKFTNPLDPFEGLGYGLSPLAPLARSGDVDNSITRFLKKFFDQGAMVTGVLKARDRLDEPTVSRIRQRWKEVYGGSDNWDETVILDQGFDYQRIGMTFKEMGFETLDDRNEARMLAPFGVPPILLNTRLGLERSTMSNYEESRRQCWEDTLQPELLLMQDDDQYYLQTEDGGYVQYDTAAVPALRKDVSKLVEAAHKLWSMGVPANQALREVGLKVGVIPNGDVAYVPTSMVSNAAVATEAPPVDDLATVDAVADTTDRPKTLPATTAKEVEAVAVGWTTEDKTRLWKAADDLAVSHEAAFRDAAAAQFEREKRELLALVGEAKQRSLTAKASIQWEMILENALDVIRNGGDEWRKAYTPLVSGVVKDAAGHWQTAAGLAFDVRNLEAEEWFVNYMATFADPISATSERVISEILQRAQREGWTVAEMQRALELTFQQWIKGTVSAEDLAFALDRLTPWRTELIARTETMRSYGAGSLQIYKANGVQRKEWLATGDDRTRDSHRNADGQQRSTGEAFEIGGYKMQHPGDMSLGAPLSEAAACRCTILPVVED